jgi:hypothetical protein
LEGPIGERVVAVEKAERIVFVHLEMTEKVRESGWEKGREWGWGGKGWERKWNGERTGDG